MAYFWQKKFNGGVEKLGAVEDAKNAIQAQARKWGHIALERAQFWVDYYTKVYGEDGPLLEGARSNLAEVQEHVGGFALALAYFTRKGRPSAMGVDNIPDAVFYNAADRSGMSEHAMVVALPYKTYSYVDHDVARLKQGRTGVFEQFWPPIPEPVVSTEQPSPSE